MKKIIYETYNEHNDVGLRIRAGEKGWVITNYWFSFFLEKWVANKYEIDYKYLPKETDLSVGTTRLCPIWGRYEFFDSGVEYLILLSELDKKKWIFHRKTMNDVPKTL